MGLVSAQKLAEMLDVKLPTVRKWVQKRIIPFVRIGRLVRFNLADVQTWLEPRIVLPLKRSLIYEKEIPQPHLATRNND